MGLGSGAPRGSPARSWADTGAAGSCEAAQERVVAADPAAGEAASQACDMGIGERLGKQLRIGTLALEGRVAERPVFLRVDEPDVAGPAAAVGGTGDAWLGRSTIDEAQATQSPGARFERRAPEAAGPERPGASVMAVVGAHITSTHALHTARERCRIGRRGEGPQLVGQQRIGMHLHRLARSRVAKNGKETSAVRRAGEGLKPGQRRQRQQVREPGQDQSMLPRHLQMSPKTRRPVSRWCSRSAKRSVMPAM
jgi:hypothetical protein